MTGGDGLEGNGGGTTDDEEPFVNNGGGGRGGGDGFSGEDPCPCPGFVVEGSFILFLK